MEDPSSISLFLGLPKGFVMVVCVVSLISNYLGVKLNEVCFLFFPLFALLVLSIFFNFKKYHG